MDNKQVYNKLIIYFGFIFAILGIIQIFSSTMLEPKSTTAGIAGGLLLVLFIFIPFWAVRVYKNQVGELTVGKAIKLGVFVGLFGSIIFGIYAVIYYKFI